MEDRSPEVASEDTERPEPPAAEPVTAAIGETKVSPSMALNATNRQLETVNAALTELQSASEREEMTVLNREDLRDAEALLPLCASDRFLVSAMAPAER